MKMLEKDIIFDLKYENITFLRKILQICAIFLLILSLCGCAKKTQTETIIDSHIEHVNQVVDYAVNNFEQTPEILQLENELSNCGLALEDAKASHKAEIATCESEKDYWRLSTYGLLILIVGAIFLRIKRVI